MSGQVGEIVVIKRTGQDGVRFQLVNNECIFGRNSTCDVRVQRPFVSREHCKIYFEEGQVFLKNLSEVNPTLLNEKPVQDFEIIKHGDVFTVIDRSFRFEFPDYACERKDKKSHRRLSASKTPLQSLQGSPRLPAQPTSLKDSIKKLRRKSVAVKEEAEESQKPDKENTPEAVADDSHVIATNTPSILGTKRKSVGGQKKRVSFGFALSPELFDKTLPPSTPLKKGSAPDSHRSSSQFGGKTPPPPGSAKKRKHSMGSQEPVLEINEVSSKVDILTHTPPFLQLETPLQPIQDVASISITNSDSKKRKKMATPLRKEIQSKPTLRQTLKKMGTPLREEIKSKPKLRETKKKIPTSLKQEIETGIELHVTKPTAPTPFREEIKKGLKLRATKKKAVTPLREEIKKGVKLRPTKVKAPTPFREEIKKGVKLRATKRKAPTPFREEIRKGIKLRATKRKAPTPLREEIRKGVKLRATKRAASTPLREEIRKGIRLRATKPMAPTPLREEIKNGVKLRVTKPKAPTPLREEIKKGVKLRSTKRAAPTPFREEIKKGVKLRATKPMAPTPFREEIKKGVKLRATKRTAPTPFREEIKKGVKLRATKRTAPTPLREEIKKGVKLRATKHTAPTPFREEIKKGVKLRATKRTAPTAFREEIKKGVKLRATKRTAPTPFREEIKKGVKLRATKRTAPTPFREEIKKGVKLRATKRTAPTPFREEIKKGVKLRATKRTAPTPFREEIKKGVKLRATKRTAPTPFREEIKKGVKLRATKRTAPALLRQEIKKGLRLRPVLRKALKTPVRKQIREGVKLRKMKSTQRPSDESKGRNLLVDMAKECGVSLEEIVIQITNDESLSPIDYTEKPLSIDLAPSNGNGTKRRILTAKRQLPKKSQSDFIFTATQITKKKTKDDDIKPPAKKRARRGSTPFKKDPESTVTSTSNANLQRETHTGQEKPGSSTTHSRRSSTLGLTRLMKTPRQKTVVSENLAGLDQLFATPNAMEYSTSATSEKSASSRTQKSRRSTTDFTGISRLMKTPKQKTGALEDLTGVKEMFASPSVHVLVKSTNSPAVKPVSHGTRKSRQDTTDLTGLSQLMKTLRHKPVASEDLTGVKEMFASPSVQVPVKSTYLTTEKPISCRTRKSKGETTEFTGLSRLMKTPQQKIVVSEDLIGVKEMFASPGVHVPVKSTNLPAEKPVSRGTRKSRQDTTDFTRLSRLIKTPRHKPVALEDLTGVKEMFASPSVQVPVKSTDLTTEKPISCRTRKSKGENTEFSGLSRLMKTAQQKIVVVSEDLIGVKELFASPGVHVSVKSTNSPAEKLVSHGTRKSRRETTDFTGLSRLMKTPKKKTEASEDLTGVGEMFASPPTVNVGVESTNLLASDSISHRNRNSRRETTDLSGLSHLMKTPKHKGEPVTDLQGVKRLMKTPKEKSSGIVEEADCQGLKRLFMEPKMKSQIGISSPSLEGVATLMKTPKTNHEAADVEVVLANPVVEVLLPEATFTVNSDDAELSEETPSEEPRTSRGRKTRKIKGSDKLPEVVKGEKQATRQARTVENVKETAAKENLQEVPATGSRTKRSRGAKSKIQEAESKQSQENSLQVHPASRRTRRQGANESLTTVTLVNSDQDNSTEAKLGRIGKRKKFMSRTPVPEIQEDPVVQPAKRMRKSISETDIKISDQEEPITEVADNTEVVQKPGTKTRKAIRHTRSRIESPQVNSMEVSAEAGEIKAKEKEKCSNEVTAQPNRRTRRGKAQQVKDVEIREPFHKNKSEVPTTKTRSDAKKAPLENEEPNEKEAETVTMQSGEKFAPESSTKEEIEVSARSNRRATRRGQEVSKAELETKVELSKRRTRRGVQGENEDSETHKTEETTAQSSRGERKRPEEECQQSTVGPAELNKESEEKQCKQQGRRASRRTQEKTDVLSIEIQEPQLSSEPLQKQSKQSSRRTSRRRQTENSTSSDEAQESGPNIQSAGVQVKQSIRRTSRRTQEKSDVSSDETQQEQLSTSRRGGQKTKPGAVEGVVETPAKMHLQKSKLDPIPEESPALPTKGRKKEQKQSLQKKEPKASVVDAVNAVKPAARPTRSRRTKVTQSENTTEDEVIQVPRKTRRAQVSREVTEEQNQVAEEPKQAKRTRAKQSEVVDEAKKNSIIKKWKAEAVEENSRSKRAKTEQKVNTPVKRTLRNRRK